MALVTFEGTDIGGRCNYEYDDAAMIGKGGAGEVFLGTRTDSMGVSTQVAIKHLTNTSDEVLASARKEASIHIHNDSLVYMYGLVEVAGSTPFGGSDYYVVSEYADGVSLALFVQGDIEGRDGNIDPRIQAVFDDFAYNRTDKATEMVKAILAGVMALHDNGYIHRDIDPTNIIVTTDGHYKLIDYGLAVRLGQGQADTARQGTMTGKVQFAAPELILGDMASQDVTTDIYAVGMLFFQLLTGHAPFAGANDEVIRQQLHAKLPMGEIASPAIRRIISKATEKRQARRYASAASFRADLDNMCLDGDGGQRLNWRKVVLVAVAALVVVGVAVAFFTSNDGGGMTASDGQDDSIEVAAEVTPEEAAYRYYKELLEHTSADSVVKGFVGMKQLAENNVPDAIFEVAYIYAFNNKATHQKTALGIKVDGNGRPVSDDIIKKGKQWLNRAIETGNPKAYQCQYWLAAYQTSADAAKRLLRQALLGANKAGDTEFAHKIERSLSRM